MFGCKKKHLKHVNVKQNMGILFSTKTEVINIASATFIKVCCCFFMQSTTYCFGNSEEGNFRGHFQSK